MYVHSPRSPACHTADPGSLLPHARPRCMSSAAKAPPYLGPLIYTCPPHPRSGSKWCRQAGTAQSTREPKSATSPSATAPGRWVRISHSRQSNLATSPTATNPQGWASMQTAWTQQTGIRSTQWDWVTWLQSMLLTPGRPVRWLTIRSQWFRAGQCCQRLCGMA